MPPFHRHEPDRRQAFERQVANGHLAAGIAIDSQRVGVHICDGVVTEVVRARGAVANPPIPSHVKNKGGFAIHPLDPGYRMGIFQSECGGKMNEDNGTKGRNAGRSGRRRRADITASQTAESLADRRILAGAVAIHHWMLPMLHLSMALR